MPKLFLLAACQAQSFALLARHMLPGADVSSVDVLDHTYYRDEALLASTRAFQDADFILIQPGGMGPYALDAVKALYPNKTFALATIYFRGLHPDSTYVGAVGDKFQEPSLYHSIPLLWAFRQGKSLRWALKNAFSYELFEKLRLFDAWDDSLDEIRRLDQEASFPIAGLIESYCLEYQGFLSFNHPAIGLAHRYLFQILRTLGLSPQPMDLSAIHDPFALHDVVPILDFVAERFHLPYRTSQLWRLSHENRFVSPEAYIRRAFAAYQAAEAEKLLIKGPRDLIRALRASDDLAFLASPEAEGE